MWIYIALLTVEHSQGGWRGKLWKWAINCEMGSFPNSFILWMKMKAKYTVSTRKLFGFKYYLPEKAKAKKISILVVFFCTLWEYVLDILRHVGAIQCSLLVPQK